MLLEHVLIVAGDSATHVGHLLGLADDATLENHELGIALALRLVTDVECRIVGIGVLALFHHHTLHADVVSVLVVEGVGKGVSTELGEISLDEVEYGIILSAENDALEVRLIPSVLGTVLVEIALQTYGILVSSLPNTLVADFEEHHAITILIEQVTVVGVALDEFLSMVLAEGCIGSSINLRHDIFLGNFH